MNVLLLVAVLLTACTSNKVATTSTTGSTAPTSSLASIPASATTPIATPTTGLTAPTSNVATTSESAVQPIITPVTGLVRYAPLPFVGEDGRTHLVYEIVLTNYTDGPVTVDSIAAQDAVTNRSVYQLAGPALAARVLPSGGTKYRATFGPGQTATIFLHVVLASSEAVPASLIHELTVTLGGGASTDAALDGDDPGSAAAPSAAAQKLTERLAPTTVSTKTLPVLGPPLRGTGYIAADGCCDAVRHTRSILPLNGSSYLAQRYAIDYEQVGSDGRIYVGSKTDNKSYRIFGQPVIAVADATVADSHDGLAEQVPGTFPKDIPITDADGNFVVLDLGNGFYANYAHLKLGSVRVKPGQRVHKGDVLGLVGNTGNSVAPHLHFHVMDAASPIVSEGLPYLIDSFTVTGRSASTAAFDTAEAEGTPLRTVPGLEPTVHQNQMVLDQSIVTF